METPPPPPSSLLLILHSVSVVHHKGRVEIPTERTKYQPVHIGREGSLTSDIDRFAPGFTQRARNRIAEQGWAPIRDELGTTKEQGEKSPRTTFREQTEEN